METDLRKQWSILRRDVVCLPKLERMSIGTEELLTEAIEYVRVLPSDEKVMMPSAPYVPTQSVEEYPDWSEAEADQSAMWRLVGQQIEGSRITRTCPDCEGSRAVTCGRCRGRGRVDCSWCSGSGYRSCSSCGGSGGHTVTHTSTDSDGNSSTTTDRESCFSCGGSGRDRCSSCFGSGTERCSTCRGDGEVECETCSPEGTVDHFIRRTFVARSIATHLLPVALPGYPEPISLTPGHVTIQPRTTGHPYDLVADQALLTSRSAPEPRAPLFFIRPARVTLHSLVEPNSGRLSATFFNGEPAPILTLHQVIPDPDWTPDQERRRALWATLLYVMSPLLLIGFGAFGFDAATPASTGLPAGVGGVLWPLLIPGLIGAALLAFGAYRLYGGPIRALRMALSDPRCTLHSSTATQRCPTCAEELCHECLAPLARCPHCGQVVSPAITHLVEGGRWVAVARSKGTDSSRWERQTG